MKSIGFLILGLVVGGGTAWFVVTKSHSTANQFHFESHISNQIKYIEIIDQKSSEALKNSLLARLACEASALENLVQQPFWEKSNRSIRLISKAKELTNGVQCGAST